MMTISIALIALMAIFLASQPDAASASAELSGAQWVTKFPGSLKVEDLDDDFQSKVEAFHVALKDASAVTTITSTLRPPERAYLMHWSWKIARQDFDPKQVPAKAGVDIEWWHGDAATSKKKAQEMVDGYGIQNLQVAPALNSRHTEGKAIDMQVSWTGDLKIKKKDGTVATITSTPRDSTNPDLIEVAKTYGVIHFADVQKDKVHWSTDGH